MKITRFLFLCFLKNAQVKVQWLVSLQAYSPPNGRRPKVTYPIYFT